MKQFRMVSEDKPITQLDSFSKHVCYSETDPCCCNLKSSAWWFVYEEGLKRSSSARVNECQSVSRLS